MGSNTEAHDLNHLAIIMDGNGRWAQARGLPRVMGHRAGVEALKKAVRLCPGQKIRYLSVYALSTENWKRPAAEIQALFALLDEFIDKELSTLCEQGVSIRVLGDLSPLSDALQEKISHAVTATAGLENLILSIALNYGGRQELLSGARALAKRALMGESPEDWGEEDLANELYTRGLPDPDLLIRTGGDMRVSNFFLWQTAYTEFWSTKTYWPDFSEEMLIEAIGEYRGRQRRFGGI
ncbi:MAG: polyprenyl diphosphate synthase [Clostridiales bacterium]|nr:polyprenyl diphosphate synthase [Clostridiales bacterium]